MSSRKLLKYSCNAVYAIGVTVVLVLCGICLFGPGEAVNPDAMIPFTWRESAFCWLAAGTFFMLPSCMTVYRVNRIGKRGHKKRDLTLILLPGLVCAACMLVIIGIMAAGFINSAHP